MTGTGLIPNSTSHHTSTSVAATRAGMSAIFIAVYHQRDGVPVHHVLEGQPLDLRGPKQARGCLIVARSEHDCTQRQ